MRSTALERCARDVVDANAALETLAASTSGRVARGRRRAGRRATMREEPRAVLRERRRRRRRRRRRARGAVFATTDDGARARAAGVARARRDARGGDFGGAERVDARREARAGARARGDGDARGIDEGGDTARLNAIVEGLEKELARAERESARLRRENALLIDATRAARKEFERRDRARDGSRDGGDDAARSTRDASGRGTGAIAVAIARVSRFTVRRRAVAVVVARGVVGLRARRFCEPQPNLDITSVIVVKDASKRTITSDDNLLTVLGGPFLGVLEHL